MTGAGELRERVAFDARIETDDGYGNKRGGFVERFRCSASFTPLRGGETVIASRLEGRQPVVVRIRASSATRLITADWRMRDRRTGVAYAVRSVIETSDRKWVDLTVESGTAA